MCTDVHSIECAIRSEIYALYCNCCEIFVLIARKGFTAIPVRVCVASQCRNHTFTSRAASQPKKSRRMSSDGQSAVTVNWVNGISHAHGPRGDQDTGSSCSSDSLRSGSPDGLESPIPQGPPWLFAIYDYVHESIYAQAQHTYVPSTGQMQPCQDKGHMEFKSANNKGDGFTATISHLPRIDSERALTSTSSCTS